MKRYLICYKPKSFKGCHKQREFDSYYEVCEFIIHIVKRGSKVVRLFDNDSDITAVVDPMIRFYGSTR